LELDGVRYVILRESVFQRLCEQAGVPTGQTAEEDTGFSPALGLDRTSLAEKLTRRRVAVVVTVVEKIAGYHAGKLMGVASAANGELVARTQLGPAIPFGPQIPVGIRYPGVYADLYFVRSPCRHAPTA